MSGTKVALITDAGHFLGPPASRALIAAGWRVFGMDAALADPDQRARLSEKLPGVDLIDAQDPGDIVAEVLKVGGQLDLLVNNDAFPALRGAIGEAQCGTVCRCGRKSRPRCGLS